MDSSSPNAISMRSHGALIEKVFRVSSIDKRVTAIVLQINSPGGSPVQCSQLSSLIMSLTKETKVPVLSYAEDVAASGGYWLLCATDEVLANKCSILGSIGVVSASFGVEEAMKALRLERRIFTAGKNKVRMSPFEKLKDEDVLKTQTMLHEIHGIFKEYVVTRRGDRLDKDQCDAIFSGDTFLASHAQTLGLIDKTVELREEMQNRFGSNVRIQYFDKAPSFLNRMFAASAGVLVDTVHSRILTSSPQFLAK